MTTARLALLGVCLAVAGCVIEEDAPPIPTPAEVPPIAEDRSVYAQDALEVLTIHLTVTDLDALAAVNDNVDGATVPVIFQEGTYGAGATAPNGTIELRGSSSRNAGQPSYKVKLDGDAWRGNTKLNLLKHPFDLTRVRNRLAFEYMRRIPNFTSLRTQFVHVYLNGEDMGLYENVENPSKRMLAAHGLPNGELYKANNFAFYDLTDAQRADTAVLDESLESKGYDSDHSKLETMLRHVNDPFVPTDYVFARHFNLDNYTTWLALNILIGNFDTSNQNFMIFSPPDSDGWYFMPWDYDGAWGFNGPNGQPGAKDRDQSRLGVGTWWLSPLHQRFLREPARIYQLEEKMNELMSTVISDDATRAMLAQFHDLIQPFVTQAPDADFLPNLPDNPGLAWETEYNRMGGVLSQNYSNYFAQKNIPMPIFQAKPIEASGNIYYAWDASYSLVGDPLTYDVEVSTTPTFGAGDIVFSQKGLTKTSTTGPKLPRGQYFWRVRVQDAAAGTWQESGELYRDADHVNYPGVQVFEI